MGDAAAPSFCPSQPAWNEAWAMPVVLSPILAGLQGRWHDGFQATYLIQGCEAHVTLPPGGQRAIVPLTESQGKVWWCSRWFVTEANVLQARRQAELLWCPTLQGDAPLTWWWSD